MDTTTAAQQARVTVATVRAWCRTGAVKATKTSGRWTIDTASLARRIALGIRRTRKATVEIRDNDARVIATWARTGSCHLAMRHELAHGGPDITGGRGTRLIAAGLLVRDDTYGVEITDLGRQVGTDITNAMANGTDRATATRDALTKAGLR
ncbi:MULTISPECIES: hypothetical protein [unclassified Nocardiopsis]|uniref:hypothetical protein n=1 Tax=Nocardiopsis TaxID=2013 RepID=UPI00387B884B